MLKKSLPCLVLQFSFPQFQPDQATLFSPEHVPQFLCLQLHSSPSLAPKPLFTLFLWPQGFFKGGLPAAPSSLFPHAWRSLASHPYHPPTLPLTQSFKNIASVIRCVSVMIYWVGQKVCLDFSIQCYGKNWINILANPIYTTYKQGLCLLSLTNLYFSY